MSINLQLQQIPVLDQNGLMSQPWLLFFLNQANAVNSGGANHIYLEIPSGVINGSNKTFTLLHAPNPANSAKGYVRQGGAGAFLPMIYGKDFTLSGLTITATTAPISSSDLYFDYVY